MYQINFYYRISTVIIKKKLKKNLRLLMKLIRFYQMKKINKNMTIIGSMEEVVGKCLNILIISQEEKILSKCSISFSKEILEISDSTTMKTMISSLLEVALGISGNSEKALEIIKCNNQPVVVEGEVLVNPFRRLRRLCKILINLFHY